jgi:PEGA domain-containing protein
MVTMTRRSSTNFVLKLIVVLLIMLAAGTFPLGSMAGWNPSPETRSKRTWSASVSPADRPMTEAKTKRPGILVGSGDSTWYGYYWSEPGFTLDHRRKVAKEDTPANTAQMSLKVRPRKAQLVIDDLHVGQAGNQTLWLPPGSHRVEIRYPGYRTLSLAMDVSQGQVYDIRYHLKRGEGTDSQSGVRIGEL